MRMCARTYKFVWSLHALCICLPSLRMRPHACAPCNFAQWQCLLASSSCVPRAFYAIHCLCALLVFRCATDEYWNTCSPHIFLCPSRVILHWLFFSCAATEILKRLHLGKAALLLVFNKWGFHWGRLELYKPNLGNCAWQHKHLTQFQYQSDLQS